MKLLNLLSKNIILEVSEKLKNQLYTKFSADTTDTREEIMSNIDLFDKYKQGLPADKRDITKYSYEELKNLISSKQSTKNISDIFTEFKKREKGIENNALKRYIKKFLEIQSELPKDKQNISKYSFLNLVKMVDDLYPKLIVKKIFDKFSKSNPELTRDQLIYYINSYMENFDLIPFETKGIDKMTFIELEHLLDGLQGKKDNKSTDKTNFDDIDLKYNENGLKIFAPLTKDQCIRLRNGRSWCTSRQGSGNMYYNYRLGHERTLYYVIDEDKPFDDLNFATVILVDPNGRMSMADKSNSGRYGGSTNLPWDEIVSKVPKLEGLKDIFQPKPLTKEERALIEKVKSVRVGENPMQSFDTPQEVDMWLEYNSPTLSSIQYSNLTPELKKKYIALGMDLNSEMIQSSEPEVLKYYISKKIDKILEHNLNQLSDQDIALLNTPMLKKTKLELKGKFSKEIQLKESKKITIDYPNDTLSKYIALYGFEEIFNTMSADITTLSFSNKSKTKLAYDIPESLGNFKSLETLFLLNCVHTLPDSIGELKNLNFLSLPDNPNLVKLPESITTLPNLSFINLKSSDNAKLPSNFLQVFETEEKGFYSRI